MVIDCDPGQDDAIALLCAARYGNLIGITTVNGNVSVDKTTHNALIVTQIAELDIPVHRGAAAPLIEPPRHADHVHGASGLNGPVLPPLDRHTASDDAVAYLLDVSRTESDLWLVPTGPLTNIALAIRQDPTFISRFAGVVLMGGSATVGNVTPKAEFNIWADPEAAAIVFDAGQNLTMVGLNLTHQVRIGAPHAAGLRDADTATAHFVADLVDFYASAVEHQGQGAAIHDACAVLAVTHPELFGGEQHHVAVELTGRLTRGMTVIDERGHDAEASNATVLFDVDADAAVDAIIGAAITPHG